MKLLVKARSGLGVLSRSVRKMECVLLLLLLLLLLHVFEDRQKCLRSQALPGNGCSVSASVFCLRAGVALACGRKDTLVERCAVYEFTGHNSFLGQRISLDDRPICSLWNSVAFVTQCTKCVSRVAWIGSRGKPNFVLLCSCFSFGREEAPVSCCDFWLKGSEHVCMLHDCVI